MNSTGLGDVARHCFSPPARRPPGAKTTFKDVDGPFHETAFVGDTHTHTHMHGTHARSRHIDRALPRFHAKETISNAEVATYTLHSSRLDSRYNSSPLFNKNKKKFYGPPLNRRSTNKSRFPSYSYHHSFLFPYRQSTQSSWRFDPFFPTYTASPEPLITN